MTPVRVILSPRMTTKPLEDWYIWESLEGGFTLAETRDGQL
jgi:hypothetical protein